MKAVRLQKYLAECGEGSRRRMEELIEAGKVRVNGAVVKELGVKVVSGVDTVQISNRFVRPQHKGIVLLNKPRGMVSTLEDPEGRPTVKDFLTKNYSSYFPVGRLDWDSTGLLLLTNDGELAERLMHPRFGVERIYHARVEGGINEAVLNQIHRGVKLSDGVVQGEAQLISSDDGSTWIELSVREGRNRVVRRLFEKLGHPVIKLKRISYGPFKLGKLPVARLRVLTQLEYETARRKVFSDKQEDKVSKPRLKKFSHDSDSTINHRRPKPSVRRRIR